MQFLALVAYSPGHPGMGVPHTHQPGRDQPLTVTGRCPHWHSTPRRRGGDVLPDPTTPESTVRAPTGPCTKCHLSLYPEGQGEIAASSASPSAGELVSTGGVFAALQREGVSPPPSSTSHPPKDSVGVWSERKAPEPDTGHITSPLPHQPGRGRLLLAQAGAEPSGQRGGETYIVTAATGAACGPTVSPPGHLHPFAGAILVGRANQSMANCSLSPEAMRLPPAPPAQAVTIHPSGAGLISAPSTPSCDLSPSSAYLGSLHPHGWRGSSPFFPAGGARQVTKPA